MDAKTYRLQTHGRQVKEPTAANSEEATLAGGDEAFGGTVSGLSAGLAFHANGTRRLRRH